MDAMVVATLLKLAAEAERILDAAMERADDLFEVVPSAPGSKEGPGEGAGVPLPSACSEVFSPFFLSTERRRLMLVTGDRVRRVGIFMWV